MSVSPSILDFVAVLRGLDVQLWMQDGQLGFDAPSGVMTAQLREQLKARKAELADFLQGARASHYAAAPGTGAQRGGTDLMPLSHGQEHLWLVEQLEPGNPAYNMAGAVRLAGALDESALHQALRALQRSHAVLQAVFRVGEDGRPQQRLDSAEVELQSVEPAPEAFQPWVQEFAQRPFNLATGPLLRAAVVRLRPREHLFVIVAHHIAADAAARDVLLQELADLYGAIRQGRPAPADTAASRYADHAAWQRERLQGELLERKLAYWDRRLRGLPTLELPTDRPRPARRRHRGALHRFGVPAALSQGLRGLGLAHDATLFMTLLAAFQALLHRYSGQDDFGVGVSFAGRDRPEFERVPGHFANIAVMRAALDGDPSFDELLGRVRGATLEAYEHRDIPFGLVVERVNPARDARRNPLFQVLFVLHKAADTAPAAFGDLRCEPVPVDPGIAQFDLTLSVAGTPSGLDAVFEYDTDLFEPATVARMAGHLLTLLDAAVRDPAQPVGRMPLMTADEYRQVVIEWNETARDYPARALNRFVEARAEEAPQAVALVFEGRCVSRAELNTEANRLAHWLRSQGVGPDVLVGVCAERSVEMVVGLLAVLKAGGAYVPFDPGQPADRQRFMIEDSAPALLLTQPGPRSRLPAGGVRVVCLQADRTLWQDMAATNLDAACEPDHLAYMIYTSGSTGRPKGAPNTHRGIVNRLLWMQERFPLDGGDCVLQKTPFTFDVSVWEFFWPLTAGARLVIAEPGGHQNPRYLSRLIAAQGVTVLHFVPSMLKVFLEAADLGECAGVRRVFSSGEALRPDTVRRFRSAWPSTQLHNLYGPTEAAVDVTWWDCSRDHERGVVPIGKPVANTRIYLLDAHGGPVPVGVPGELHIGGAQLARGYHRRGELTAERFIHHPGLGLRLYKTGDLARWLPDGHIDYLGRLDHQVKLRGLRIELGEIEALLLENGEVREAAVVAADGPAGPELVAYVAPPATRPGLEARLRSWLKSRLPEAMVPAAFVELPSLPLTSHGKADRSALPAHRRQGTAHVAPRTPTQECVAAVWRQALAVEHIGIHDDFFELGGHSLAAMQVVAQLHRLLGVELSLRALFDAPTVAGLAESIDAGGGPGAGQAPPLEPDPSARHEPFPLSDVQRAYWLGRADLFEYGNAAAHLYQEIENQGLDLGRLEEVLNRLIARHDALRLVVRDDGRQQVLPEVPRFAIQALDLRGRPADEAGAALAQVRDQMSHRIYDAGRWPLFDVRASLLDGGEVRLHLSLDLLIFDGSSLLIVARELAQLYRDPEAALPRLDVSIRDFMVADRASRGTERHRQSMAYWRDRFDGFPPAPELPLMRRPELLARPRFTRRSAGLPREAWSRLKRFGARRGLAPTHIVLAAFSDVLAAWSKHPRFTLNLTLYHRPALHPQLDQLVGDFTALELLAVDSEPAASFEARAKGLQRRLWTDLDHRRVNGVEVLQALAKHRGGTGSVAMPIVVTSLLHHKDAVDAITLPWQARMGFGVSQTPQMWLDHQVIEVQGGLVFNWDAIEGLFPPGMVDDMFAAYGQRLLALAQDESAWAQSAADLVPAAQLAQRAAVNATGAPLPTALLQELVAAQAARGGGRPAVIAADRTLSYAELAGRSHRIGRWLREQGAAPNELVAVVMDKGWQQIVAVLSVLQSGAAYLPIDADLPRQRQHLLLRQGGVRIALTRADLQGGLDLPQGLAVASVDDDARWQGWSDEPLAPVQQPSDLAYVIYTSGSTGNPKGVMIDHRGAVNTVLDVNERFGVGPGDRVFALSALNFDLSVYDTFGPLAAGGALVLPGPGELRDPDRWAPRMAATGVTLWNSVPALFELLVAQAERQGRAAVRGLRLALLSGDWIPVTLPPRAWALAPGIELHSLGGATEASIWSIAHAIAPSDASRPSIPYGKPLRNQRLHVLDAALDPRPVWVPGELYIAGAGLARGYWRDEELTRASFIVHPRTGERLYRTGDWGRYLPDGAIEFLGREDGQVKVGGHRIELGEIESVLAAHPQVQAAVATVAGDRHQRRLLAHVVRRGGAAPVELPRPGESELQRAFASRRTRRAFLRDEVPLEALSALLASLAPRGDSPGSPSRSYGSASGLYAVHAYVVAKPGRVQGLAGGSYRYDPPRHSLLPVRPGVVLDTGLHLDFNRAVAQSCAFSIFLVADLETVGPKYGGDGRDFCLLEAGAMTQLLQLAAPACGLGLCEMGDLRDIEPLRGALAVDERHALLHVIVGGLPDPQAPVPPPPGTGLRGGPPPDTGFAEALRRYLVERLPAYMVPPRIVVHAALPLSPNGKVDRQALAAWTEENPPARREAAPPRSGLQRDIEACLRAEMAKESIGHPTVGIDDNFFDLGLSSLGLIQLHGRLQAALQREFSVVKLFEHASIRALAEWLGGAQLDEAGGADAAERARKRTRNQARRRARQG